MNEKQALLAVAVVLLIVLAVVGAYFCIPMLVEREGHRVGVIVTIVPQMEFVEEVGGDKVRVTVMVPSGAELHTYEPTAGQMKDVAKAKMYAKVGSGVEFELNWLDKMMENNKAMRVIDCSEGIELMEMVGEEDEHDEEHHYGGEDPHIWTSPLNARVMVETICDGLIEIDPANANYYIQNKDNYLKELEILDVYIHYKLDGFTNRVFMMYHPAFGYLADDYNLTQLAIEQYGKGPTSQDIQTSVDKAKQYNLEYVFVEPQFPAEYAEIITDETGGKIETMNPLARDYVSNMARIADLLALEFGT